MEVIFLEWPPFFFCIPETPSGNEILIFIRASWRYSTIGGALCPMWCYCFHVLGMASNIFNAYSELSWGTTIFVAFVALSLFAAIMIGLSSCLAFQGKSYKFSCPRLHCSWTSFWGTASYCSWKWMLSCHKDLHNKCPKSSSTWLACCDWWQFCPMEFCTHCARNFLLCWKLRSLWWTVYLWIIDCCFVPTRCHLSPAQNVPSTPPLPPLPFIPSHPWPAGLHAPPTWPSP